MKRIFLYLFLSCAVLSTLESCQGCSESGRNSIRNRENYAPRRIEKKQNENSIEAEPIENSKKKSDGVGEKTLTQLYDELNHAVLYIETSDGTDGFLGSGFVISSSGVCVSNYHVFEGTTQGLENVYLDGKSYKVEEVLDRSKENDYIIFRLKTSETLPCLTIASEIPDIGEPVFAIGNPKGLDKTLSTGIVSQHRKQQGLIQITPEITNGSSGGALFNMKGEVVGITSSGLAEANLNFAVDIQLLPYKKYQKKNSKSLDTDHSSFLPSSTCGELVHHTYYSLSYCEDYEQAEWVAYKLKKEFISGNISRTDDFREDPKVVTGSAMLEDYKYSGYDRGHLLPAACMKHSELAMSETFYMSNMSPQVGEFNGGMWHSLEKKVRSWLYHSDSLYVVTGSVLDQSIGEIGTSNVTVPKYFYKVVLRFEKGEMHGIGFIMENKRLSGSIMNFAVTIQELENRTGIDFFASLPLDIQNDIESDFNLSKWR